MREAFTSVEPGLQEATSGDEIGLAGAEGGMLKGRSPPRHLLAAENMAPEVQASLVNGDKNPFPRRVLEA